MTLAKKDLYIKPEKCKWKVREVEFLGVVIGPEMSRPLTVDFIYFYFLSFVLFFLFFSFLFSIFRAAQVRGYQSRCHISHNLMA